jgi:hypothetical protein
MGQTTLCSLLLLPVLAGLSAAQSSTIVNMFLPDIDTQTLLGSVVSADSTATLYNIACPSGEDSSDCGLAGMTVLQGPSTALWHLEEPTQSV